MKKQITSTQFDLGKVAPQAIELEKIVLGALMTEKDAIDKIDLTESDFYDNNHALIFKAIKRLKSKHVPIDIFTVSDELTKMGELDTIGGSYFLALLSANVVSATNIHHHALIIKQKSIARNLISLSNEIQEMAYNQDTDVADIMEHLEKQYTDISTGNIASEASDINQSLEDTYNYLIQLQNNAESGKQIAIPTGLKELDHKLNGGWRAPDLIVLGGRPSMGKTQFAVHFAKHAGLAQKNTLVVSIEMTKIQLIIRMITEDDGIDFYRLKTGRLTTEEWELVHNRITEISKLNLNIADDHNIRYLNNIKSLARKMSRKGKLDFLIIDYLQLIKTNAKFGTRDLEIGYITGELKKIGRASCRERV